MCCGQVAGRVACFINSKLKHKSEHRRVFLAAPLSDFLEMYLSKFFMCHKEARSHSLLFRCFVHRFSTSKLRQIGKSTKPRTRANLFSSCFSSPVAVCWLVCASVLFVSYAPYRFGFSLSFSLLCCPSLSLLLASCLTICLAVSLSLWLPTIYTCPAVCLAAWVRNIFCVLYRFHFRSRLARTPWRRRP